MSQEGASRWARGNQCSLASSGDMPWSVQWNANQVLVHYYTGVRILDANNNNSYVVPTLRWNPLSINWGTPDNRPPSMSHGGSYPINVQVQNTSEVSDWACVTPMYLRYRWSKPGSGVINSAQMVQVACPLPRGTMVNGHQFGAFPTGIKY
jgi:hypothetical protein